MQQVLAKMVDTVAALLETFFGSQNNLSVQGLGAGGLGVPAEILRRMLVSPETERAMMEILPQGRDRELRQKIKIDGKGMYQPNESDFRGWRNEINLKMNRTLNEMGLDKNAARLFKQRTANMAYQIDRLCRKYTDPIERNQKVSALIDREINMAVQLTQKEEVIWIQDKDSTKQELGNITGGIKEKTAFFNGFTSSQAIPVWVPDMAVDRLHEAGPEMERMHQLQMATLEKAEMRATDKLSLQSIEEGVKKGVFTADDLLRKSVDMYASGDNIMLARLGLITKYEEYKSSLLLENTTRADRIWNDMKHDVQEYIQKTQGTNGQILGQELVHTERIGNQMSMGFGLKL